MTRSDELLFEPRIADWLEEDPYAAPDQALDVVLAAFPSIKQRRALRVPWRIPGMTTPLRLGLTAAAVGAVAIGSLFMVNNGPSGPGGPDGPPPTPTPVPTQSADPSPLPTPSFTDTSAWTTFTSSRYGYTIDHPVGWYETPADHDWTFENDVEAWQSSGIDSFLNAEGSVRVSAWSAIVDRGSTLESLIETYCLGQKAGPCPDVLEGTEPVETADGHSGLYVPRGDPMAFFLDGRTMYVVAVWREEDALEVRPYGGARQVIKTFVSTLTLPVESPLGSPAAS